MSSIQAILRDERIRRNNGQRSSLHKGRYRPTMTFDFFNILAPYWNETQNHGRKFMFSFSSNPTNWFAVNAATLNHLITEMMNQTDLDMFDEGVAYDSKTEVARYIQSGFDGDIIIEELDNTVPDINLAGAYYPFTVHHPDSHIQLELKELAIYPTVEVGNYKHHCLYIALTRQNATPVMMQEFISCFKGGAFKVTDLQRIATAGKTSIAVELSHQPGQGKRVYHWDGIDRPSTTKCEYQLALIDKCHYISNHKTQVTAYALENYEALKTKKEWWRFRSDGRRNSIKPNSNNISACALVMALKAQNYFKPIDYSCPDLMKCTVKATAKISTDNFVSLSVDNNTKTKYKQGKWNVIKSMPKDIDEKQQQVIKKIMEKRCELKQPNVDERLIELIEHNILKNGMSPTDQLRQYYKVHNLTTSPVIFYDFETSTQSVSDDEGDSKIHMPYMVSYSDMQKIEVKTKHGNDCATQMFKAIAFDFFHVCTKDDYETYQSPNILMIAHNHNYDLAFILAHLKDLKTIEDGKNKYSASGKYYTFAYGKKICLNLQFHDSYKMIASPLSGFTKMFALQGEKEAIPYSAYTREFTASDMRMQVGSLYKVCMEEKLGDFKKIDRKWYNDMESEAETFFKTVLQNASNWGCICDGLVDMKKYSQIYCEQDVRVLKEGYTKFRNDFMSEFKVDILAFLTISSVSNEIIAMDGCYKDVYSIKSIPREFIGRCNVGGRTMMAHNQMTERTGKIADYDGCSLYPSSQYRLTNDLGGYLMGEPKIWDQSIDLSSVDGYFLKVKILSVERADLAFPVCSVVDQETSTRNWTNDIVGRILYVDRITAEDLQTFHGAKYEILEGYYFNDGRNPQIGETIKKMYDRRLQYKKEGNPLQNVLKAPLVCSCGKTSQRAHEDDCKYLDEGDRDAHLARWYQHIKHSQAMPNGQWRIVREVPIDSHYNEIHISSEILSMARRIMNEVFDAGRQVDADITYSDTDSMHIDMDGLERLKIKYSELYGRELDGKQLTQFHTDFDEIVKGVKGVHAIKSIVLGKKTYLDILTDNDGNIGFHARAKGIPNKVMVRRSLELYGHECETTAECMEKLYRQLQTDPAGIEFDLNNGGIVFKTNKAHVIQTGSMSRLVSFATDGETGLKGKKYRELKRKSCCHDYERQSKFSKM